MPAAGLAAAKIRTLNLDFLSIPTPMESLKKWLQIGGGSGTIVERGIAPRL